MAGKLRRGIRGDRFHHAICAESIRKLGKRTANRFLSGSRLCWPTKPVRALENVWPVPVSGRRALERISKIASCLRRSSEAQMGEAFAGAGVNEIHSWKNAWKEPRSEYQRVALGLLSLFSFVLVLASAAPAHAQAEIPVIDILPDANGVDMATGSYVVRSKLNVQAPGAGHLSLSHLMRQSNQSSSLHIYIRDNTFLPDQYGDKEKRDIVVNIGPLSRLFQCDGFGPCTPTAKIDGSQLIRYENNDYKFSDRDGTEIRFFPIFYSWTSSSAYDCVTSDDGSTECNYAGYGGILHAREIKYSDGETLTFLPEAVASTWNGVAKSKVTIRSNLGYEMNIYRPNDGFAPTDVSNRWYNFTSGNNRVTVLSRSGAAIRENTMLATGSLRYGYPEDSRIIQLSDNLNRTYTAEFKGSWGYHCGPVLAVSVRPVRAVTPGGVETQFSGGDYHVPSGTWRVGTLTRGGVAWNYTHGYGPGPGSTNQVTAASPTGGG